MDFQPWSKYRKNSVQCWNGKKIYFDPNDNRGIALKNNYGNVNPNSVVLWDSALQAHNWEVVIDVGANYGEMLILSKIPTISKIYAFEPNPKVSKYLKRTLKQVKNQTVLSSLAISNEISKQKELAIDLSWSGTSGLLDNDKFPKSMGNNKFKIKTVTTTTIDDFLSISPRTFAMKVDVEGNELKVIQGAIKTFEKSEDWVLQIEILHDERLDKILQLLPNSYYFGLNLETKLLCNINKSFLEGNLIDRNKLFKINSIYNQDILISKHPIPI